MPYLFYREETSERAVVDLMYYVVPPEDFLSRPYIIVEDVPLSDNSKGVPQLYVNPLNKEVWYEYKAIPKTQQEERFERIEGALIMKAAESAKARYDLLNKETATIEEVREYKYNELKESCDNHILNGFYSASTDAQYGFSETDQMNMTQQMILFFINPSPIMWKTEDKGLVELTKEQFLVLAFEAQAHKEKQIGHWWQLKANILAAQTKEEIMAFEWDGTIL